MTERIQYPAVYLGLYALLMTAVAAAMYATAEPGPAALYTLFWGALYGAGLYLCRSRGEENDANFQQVARGAALLALLLFLASLTGGKAESGLVLLLLTLQAGRNLVLAGRRDLNFACLISLVLLLYGAGKAMQWHFILFLVSYALAGMFTFMADHIDARLSHAHGGDRELLTRRMHLPVKGVGLALLTLAVAALVYLLVPRPPSPRVQLFPSSSNWNYDSRHWEREVGVPSPGANGAGGDGGKGDGNAGSARPPQSTEQPGAGMLSPDRDPGLQRLDVTKSAQGCGADGILLYLQAEDPLYARGRVLDSFDGRNWQDSGYGAEKRYQREGRFLLDGKPQPDDAHQIFTVCQDLPPFIFAAYRPVQVAFPSRMIEIDQAQALRAPDRLRKGTVYTVASRQKEVDRHPCSGAPTAGDEGRTADRRYLTLYPGLSPRLRELALQATRGAGDDLERAKALERYLRRNFAYTLNTVGVQWSGNPVEQFLFELKAGHCELFASSMVIMLRTLEIPARLATGFRAHRYNPVTGYFEVRSSDGHAWVEAYLPPHGWVTFEPTSGFRLPERSQRPFFAPGLIRYLGDRIESLVQRNPDSLWVELLRTLWEGAWKLALWGRAILVAIKLTWYLLLDWLLSGGWVPVAAGCASLPAGWYLWRRLEPVWRLARLRRMRCRDPQQFPVLCYREMERHFARRGTARAPHLTPLEYERLLGDQFPPLAGEIALITRLFEQRAYGPAPVAVAETAQALRAFTAIQRGKKTGRAGAG